MTNQSPPKSYFTRFDYKGDTLSLHYHILGQPEPGAHEKPKVIMLHGSGPGSSSLSNFNRNLEILANNGFAVYLLDFPGWSKSSPIVCDSSRSHFNALALEHFMNNLGLDKAHLVGNSMGAHSAVAFTLDNPLRVDKLILMGGGTGGISNLTPSPTEGIKLLQALYRAPTIENFRNMMSAFVYHGDQIDQHLLDSRLAAMQENPTHLDNFVKSLQCNPHQYPDFGSQLSSIAQQTLIVWGKNDRFVPMEVGLRLMSHIPNSQLHVFNQCGHWAQWEHAEAFNRLMLNFLR